MYEQRLKALADTKTKDVAMDQSNELKESKAQNKKLERVNYEQMQQVKELNLSIEMLKHQKVMLEEWKTEIGLVAIDNVETLQCELETKTNTAQQYQLEIEGLQTQNNAFNQHIATYEDETNKLKEEQAKLEAQIDHFEQALKEQYAKTE